MTVKELSQVYMLQQEIDRYDRRIDELRAQRTAIQAPSFDKEPGGHGDPAHSKIETLTAEIIDLEELLRLHRRQRVLECQRLERYIAGVEDPVVRQIMQMRFADLVQWPEIAKEMNYSIEAVKKRLYRYLEKHDENGVEIVEQAVENVERRK